MVTGFSIYDVFLRLLPRVAIRVESACWRVREFYYRLLVKHGCRYGVNREKRTPEIIVSLTTIPERLNTVALCLETLLRQSIKPDRLILWLSPSNAPGKRRVSKDNIPIELLSLEKRGLEIRWCEDIRSFRKIIPTLECFPNDIIVTADDDILYPVNWLSSLLEAYRKEPQYIHCHRAHFIKYDESGCILPYRQWDLMSKGYVGPSNNLFPTTGAGVLYAPHHLHHEVMNRSVFMELCPNADDIWLYAMAQLKKVNFKKVKPYTYEIIEIRIPDNTMLCSENFFNNGNDRQIKLVSERYSVFCISRCKTS